MREAVDIFTWLGTDKADVSEGKKKNRKIMKVKKKKYHRTYIISMLFTDISRCSSPVA